MGGLYAFLAEATAYRYSAARLVVIQGRARAATVGCLTFQTLAATATCTLLALITGRWKTRSFDASGKAGDRCNGCPSCARRN